MSNIYIQEPPTNGKVLLKTSAGDIDIELWSKETPKACRNFVQLCMEGYYDGTIFHRMVPEFIVQGGDPTGTGTGGESIYGRPFKDEFHSRLRFNRRGLVAMANAGPHDNGSQFFFTLGRADELNNKHTIFGKVTGDTVYNMLRLADVACDGDERPLNPHKIRSTEVLHSPFDDIIPREIKGKKEKNKDEAKKSQSKATKNFSLLSFGEEAEEDEEMVNQVSQTMKGKSKSSHDLLKDDPKLSSVPVVDRNQGEGDFEDSDDDEDDAEDDSDREAEKAKVRENIAKKLKKDKTDEEKSSQDLVKKTSRSDELRKEARQLKKELLAIKQRKEDGVKKEEDVSEVGDSKQNSEAVTEYLESRKKYDDMRKQKLKKGSGREAQTLALLESFKSKLSSAISETPSAPEEDVEELAEDDDKGWMAHVLHFDEQSRKVKDANMQDEDTFEIYDPRNPVNKRRREESKKLLKDKKARR
ncbi:spliceosome-associated protein CWC27 homolog [Danio rerio]|uniref:Spliceosome-associated protein CWC27 homolog n=1 Tax=Danio rerio TaxID=7955 RepID=CWC27_DANRE|nr:spliceosome-associated protein CWC27 homolog [Danio rerio]Q7ZW86.1 RecName: Full=Spliceosome-associated protein CWC27 homolog; AltName: Full=Probable inactive peptidyl-prolyl cis-trans isomerase CWC27 homolog; Short=PPIase CWC27 [Danio rerio]AAH49533.1 Zgc:56702 [Danio rerio]|eukprot:NP_957397.1 spliceosome-associated protein CWC27 homolog [Danio rerio]